MLPDSNFELVVLLQKGVLYNHMIMPNGYYRHSVYYIILDTEWSEVKKRLDEMVER